MGIQEGKVRPSKAEDNANNRIGQIERKGTNPGGVQKTVKHLKRRQVQKKKIPHGNM